MSAREIPHSQWPRFLENFGFHHFGWNATLEQKSRGRDKLIAANHSFLEELTTGGADGHQQITIVLCSPFHGFHTHVVSDPRRVRVAGKQTTLRIDSADGSATVVRLRQPSRAA